MKIIRSCIKCKNEGDQTEKFKWEGLSKGWVCNACGSNKTGIVTQVEEE